MKHNLPLWNGSIPDACDVCGTKIYTEFSDMRTKFGPWGILCGDCVTNVGVGYGPGKGQHFTKQPDGSWAKDKG